MKEPQYILPNGTKVVVHETLGETGAFFIKEETLARRTPGVHGQICGIVGGHGGDVYWVRHNGEENTGSAYGFWEFELDPEPIPTVWERL